jgi:spermidine synthase
LIPVALAPRLDTALVIGLGSGYSAHVLHEVGVADLDIAELSPGIVAATRTIFGDLNGHLLDQPQVHLHLEDGRNFLLLTDRRYDLISMEITSVWFAGATSVYSREFYEQARAHLTEAGVLQQWVQMHHLTVNEVDSTLATVRQVFPYVELYVRGGQGVIVASEKPLEFRPIGLAAISRFPLRGNDTADQVLLNLASSELLSSADIDHLLTRYPLTINTDWNRYLEYATPRYATVHANLFAINYRELKGLSTVSRVELDREVGDPLRQLFAGLSAAEREGRREGTWTATPTPSPLPVDGGVSDATSLSR